VRTNSASGIADGQRIQTIFKVLAPTRTLKEDLKHWSRVQYVKEVFGNSDTVMATQHPVWLGLGGGRWRPTTPVGG
jgi:hypothetical protein